MKKIIAFTFMVLFVTSFALAKKVVEKPSSTPSNAISFTVDGLNIKDKVKVENLTQDEFLLTVQFYDGEWKTVGIANFDKQVDVSSKTRNVINVKTNYEDKLKKYRDNTWCVVFPAGTNSDEYALHVTESHHDLYIQIIKK